LQGKFPMRLDSLDKLRARIKQIEGRTNSFESTRKGPLKGEKSNRKNSDSHPVWSFGTDEIDQFFPRGLSPHALHEITPADYRDSWASLSFSLALLSRCARLDQRPLLWCSSSPKLSEFGRLYGHGLRRFNIDPTRFIVIETKNDHEAIFVLEEALKSARLCAVLGLIDALNLIPSRRLSLMAAKGQTPALLITKPGHGGIKTAATRWQVAALPPGEQLDAQFSFPQLAWQVALTRNRQGPADKKWHLEFPSYDLPFNNHAKKAFRFTCPSPFRNRKSKSLEIKIKTKAA
jgi:protein ImuA